MVVVIVIGEEIEIGPMRIKTCSRGEFDLARGGAFPKHSLENGTWDGLKGKVRWRPLSRSFISFSNSNPSAILKKENDLREKQRCLKAGSPSKPTKPLAIALKSQTKILAQSGVSPFVEDGLRLLNTTVVKQAD